MGVDGKSGADFFREMAPPVVAGGEFDIYAGSFSVGGVVLDAYVRKRDLSPHHLKPILFCDPALAFGGCTVRTEFREVMVEPLFQLIVEDNAEVPPARALNFACRLLVEAVEVGVM